MVYARIAGTHPGRPAQNFFRLCFPALCRIKALQEGSVDIDLIVYLAIGKIPAFVETPRQVVIQ